MPAVRFPPVATPLIVTGSPIFGCKGDADADIKGFWATAAAVVVAGFAVLADTSKPETGSIIHAAIQNSAHITIP
jgi:hypothetical protein